jgi:drug/metabolite transporter (DMT)-like permease
MVDATVPLGHALWARVLLWLVPGLWASNYIIARSADGVISPHLLATGRWLLAALLMLLVLGPKRWRGLALAWREEWRQLLVLGALGMWICGAWLYQGARTTSAANIALLYSVTPVAIAALGARLLKERLSAYQVWGAGLALLGVLFVITQGDLSRLLRVRFSVGDLWVLACAAAWTAYSVLLRHWPSRLEPGVRLVAIILGGLLPLVVGSVVELVLDPGPPLGAKALTLVALAAVLPGALSYVAFSYLQRELGVARTALMMYLAPIYGALLGWLLLGERPGWYHLVGAALILPSIALATQAPSRTGPAR